MKILTEHPKRGSSFISSTMTLLIEKHSLWGRNPQIDVLGLLNRFLKDETMEKNPLSSLFVPQNMTTFLNRGAKA